MEPKVAQKAPYMMDLKPDTYYWCKPAVLRWFARTAQHRNDAVEFKLTDAKKVALCGCKQTKNPPYCDGTHMKL